MNGALRVLLQLSRRYALKAAHVADQEGDSQRHGNIMLALTALDDALDPDGPLSPEVIQMWKEAA